MAVYVDEAGWPWRGKLLCHLFADDLEGLHAFASRLGLKRAWYQHLPQASAHHYDVTESARKRAVALGSIEVDRRGAIQRAKHVRELRKAHAADAERARERLAGLDAYRMRAAARDASASTSGEGCR
jgi:hypothetical protein